jgi:NIPSNAP
MSVYMHVTLEVRGDGLHRFMTEMAKALPVLEGAGWVLTGAFVQRSGRLNTVIDLWELRDMNHYQDALGALAGWSGFGAFKQMLDECVLSETIVFADKAPYMR